MSYSQARVDAPVEGADETTNNLAVKYIIPVSVIVGVLLAAITIGCVCYRRWRFFVKIKKQHPEKPSNDQTVKDQSDSKEFDESELEDDKDEESLASKRNGEANTLATDEQLIGDKRWRKTQQPVKGILSLDAAEDIETNRSLCQGT